MFVNLKEAKAIIDSGNILAVPTDTVYGIAASSYNYDAILKIYKCKNRDYSKKIPLQICSTNIFIDSIDHKKSNINFCKKLADCFWPGPLTISCYVKLLKSNQNIVSEDGSCAFRISDNITIRSLIDLSGPLVISSANKSSDPICNNPTEIEEVFGNSFPILDGQRPHINKESTVIFVDMEKVIVLRHGAISCDEISLNFGLNMIPCSYCYKYQ